MSDNLVNIFYSILFFLFVIIAGSWTQSCDTRHTQARKEVYLSCIAHCPTTAIMVQDNNCICAN